jgi:hypothetical protein
MEENTSKDATTPPSVPIEEKESMQKLSAKQKTVFVSAVCGVFFGLWIINSIINGFYDRAEQKKASLEAGRIAFEKKQKTEAILDEFEKNKDKILSDAKASMDKKDFQAVLDLTGKYLFDGESNPIVKDENLLSLNKEAENLLNLEIENNRKLAKATKLVEELKGYSPYESEKCQAVYKQLVELYPNNAQYRANLETYDKMVLEQEKADNAAAEKMKAFTDRKARIESGFSVWDGSHKELTKRIKASMNDEDSYEHVKTGYIDKGDFLIVETIFSGKNAFGARMKNKITAKVSLDGEVLEIISQEP